MPSPIHPNGSRATASTRTPILPGDSVVTIDFMRVIAAAGPYSLRIRHPFQPEAWAEQQVQVQVQVQVP